MPVGKDLLYVELSLPSAPERDQTAREATGMPPLSRRLRPTADADPGAGRKELRLGDCEHAGGEQRGSLPQRSTERSG